MIKFYDMLMKLRNPFHVLFILFILLSVAANVFAAEPAYVIKDGPVINDAVPNFLQKKTGISLSDAVLKTLQANPGIFVNQKKVSQSEGMQQKAAGQFDWTILSQISVDHQTAALDSFDQQLALDSRTASGFYKRLYTRLGIYYPLDELEVDSDTYSLGLAKQFRSGVTVYPSVNVVDYDSNGDIKVPISRSEMSIELNVPLLRGLGVKATGADELAAISQVKAAQLIARQNIAQIIYETSLNYWNSLAAKMSFELMTDTQERSKKLLDLVEKLVHAGSLERAALNQAKANLLRGQVELSNGETYLYTSRQGLGLAMGMTFKELINDAPDPESSFPNVIDAELINKIEISQFIDEALKNRGDYLAAQTNIETANILLNKAQNDTKPKFDLGMKLGYDGEDEESSSANRYFNSLSNNTKGLNYRVSLALALPIFNNAARGNLVYHKSQFEESELMQSYLSQRIASEVLVSYKAFSSAINEYQLASESEKSYQKAVEFETQKYKAGLSTLTALIDIEDRYFRARIATIEALRKYSIAMAKFRLVTGTMLDVQDKKLNFDEQKLLEFPLVIQGRINDDKVKK